MEKQETRVSPRDVLLVWFLKMRALDDEGNNPQRGTLWMWERIWKTVTVTSWSRQRGGIQDTSGGAVRSVQAGGFQQGSSRKEGTDLVVHRWLSR